MPSQAEYKPGQVLFEPFLGMCQVVNFCEETILGVRQRFYELRTIQGNACVKIPAVQMSIRGIRPPMTQEQLNSVLQIEDEPEIPDEDSGSRMQRWVTRLRSQGTSASPQVLRQLKVLEHKGLPLTGIEIDLQNRIGQSLRAEIASVMGLSRQGAERILRRAVDLPKVIKPRKK